MSKGQSEQVQGLFVVLEAGEIRGLRYWGADIKRRKIPAVFNVKENDIDEDPDMVKDLSDSGIEIGGSFLSENPAEEPYERQLLLMGRIRDKILSCTKRPMRVFNLRHFLHNEATIKAAHKLGVKYVLMRGPGGTKALIYKPKEYNVVMVAMSMIPAKIKGMGMSSLCEQYPAGGTPEYLKKNLFGLKTGKATVAVHTYLGGVKLRWWNAYQEFLDAGTVKWLSVDEFAANPTVLPYAKIPSNIEIKYNTPRPAVPLDQEPEYQPK